MIVLQVMIPDVAASRCVCCRLYLFTKKEVAVRGHHHTLQEVALLGSFLSAAIHLMHSSSHVVSPRLTALDLCTHALGLYAPVLCCS